MTQQVTDESGTIHYFPDDASPDEMNGAIGAPGFGGRVNDDLKVAMNKIGGIWQKDMAGQINPASAGVQMLGTAGAAAFSPVTEGVKSAIASTPDAVKQPFIKAASAVSGGAQSAADAINDTGAGQKFGDFALRARDAIAKLAEEHPEAVDNMKAAGNIFGTAGAMKTAAGISNAIPEEAENASSNIFLNNQGVKMAKDVPLTAENLRDMASRSYDAADALGGRLHPDAVDKWINNAATVLPQTQAGAAVLGPTSTSSLVQRLQAIKGQPLTLQGAQEIDSGLGALMENEVIPATGKLNAEGTKLSKIQANLRSTIENAGPGDIIGGPQGFDAWKEGRQLWATSQRANDVERIINKASMMDNPVTGIKVGFRTLSSNPARMRGFTDDEVAAIHTAANTGMVQNALRTGGSRLISSLVGAAGGGPAGAAMGYGLSRPLAAAADSLQKAKANAVLKLLSNRPAVSNYGP